MAVDSNDLYVWRAAGASLHTQWRGGGGGRKAVK